LVLVSRKPNWNWGLIFGPEFGTGTEDSIFSKKESEPMELELELEPASGILKTN